jgi:hypothetical protein
MVKTPDEKIVEKNNGKHGFEPNRKLRALQEKLGRSRAFQQADAAKK